MIIGGIQKTSLIDYPGKISAIVFTRGCPFRCHYCHNPGLVLPERFQRPISEELVMQFLEARKEKLDGIVVTGGEPLIHKDIPKFLQVIKEMGYLIKLDTSGAFPDLLEALINARLINYVAMDVKAPFGRYDEVAAVSVDTEAIMRSIGLIKGSDVDYEFRTTVVKGQLSEDDITTIAKSIRGAKRYVLQRFRKCDVLDPTFEMMETYSEEEFERIRENARKYVDVCEIR